MNRFALTGLAMAFALIAQVQAEEQVPPPPAGPYQSFALMPASPEAGPQSVHFPPMNYTPESLGTPDMPQAPAWVQERPEPPARPAWAGEMPQPAEMGQPSEMLEPPAWVQERPEPPARPAWAGEMPQPAEMGRPPEMPEAPAWVQERPEPPARPAWAGEMPEPAEMGRPPEMLEPPAWVKERPEPPARPAWAGEMPQPAEMGRPPEMPEPPAWVQERQQWQGMRGRQFSPPPRRFHRPPTPPSWGQPYRAERGFPPAGYEQQLTPPAPPARFPSEPYRGPYVPYYPR
jgi:hypothetical protein